LSGVAIKITADARGGARKERNAPNSNAKNTGAFETNNKPEKSFQARQCESRDEDDVGLY
jgi:hypothetical protein